jgi:ribosome biogenesis protein NSA2
LTGLRAKLYQKKRHHEKIQMKKQIKSHEERSVKSSPPNEPSSTPLPGYLLDRSNPTSAKALSSAIKQKRAEKAARFSVPLPKVKGISEQEMFKVVTTGKKTAKKSWKRMITKPTFVGPVSQPLSLWISMFTYFLGLHSSTCQVREIYKANGSSVQAR